MKYKRLFSLSIGLTCSATALASTFTCLDSTPILSKEVNQALLEKHAQNGQPIVVNDESIRHPDLLLSFLNDEVRLCTSYVEDMSDLFATHFHRDKHHPQTVVASLIASRKLETIDVNPNLSDWDTRKVTNMSGMFDGAIAFNQPIGDWDTSKVTNMYGMFWDARTFNQPIGNWNTSKVTNMQSMFIEANDFNQPIGNWNTSKVTNMQSMFMRAASFDQPIANWNTSKVTNMEDMFMGATNFDQPIKKWNTSKVTNMKNMFNEATQFWKTIGIKEPDHEVDIQSVRHYIDIHALTSIVSSLKDKLKQAQNIELILVPKISQMAADLAKEQLALIEHQQASLSNNEPKNTLENNKRKLDQVRD